MSLYLLKVVKWILSKLVFALLAGALLVGVFAAYLFLGDSIRAEQERMTALQGAQGRARAVYKELETIHGEIVSVAEEIDATRERLQTANALIEELEGLLSKLGYLFSSESERKSADERLAKAKAESERLRPFLESLSQRDASLKISRAALAEEASLLEERISDLQKSGSELARYVNLSWNHLRPLLPVVIGAALLGPVALKATAFFAIAPIFQRARPIRFALESQPEPSELDSGVSVTLRLKESEKAWVKESYLQASDEDMERRSRFVLNWKIPFTCLAAGLVELIEFFQTTPGAVRKITVSTQERAEMELSLIEVPTGGSLVLRPSHLVGLISADGEAILIRRRWSFGRAQAWMTLQFRFFEFVGPCRLVVAGVRGVRTEQIESTEGGGRRANQDATIGFTPDLDFGAVRAETFWAYLRGFNPLFDDVFRGKGVFLCQEIAIGAQRGPRRFWAGFRDALLKLVGV